MECYTGVRDIKLKSEIINQLYKEKFLDISENRVFDKRYSFPNQNEYIVITDIGGTSQSAITRVYKDQLILINGDKEVHGIKPRNREQRMALDALMNDDIPVVVLTGRAGTGKSLLALCAALDRMENKEAGYKKMILSRPMSWVGKYGLGTLPGTAEEKFRPYLQNYICNLNCISNGKTKIEDMEEFYNMEFVPIQLIRGASWSKCFILLDEIQVLGHEEMVALGTRVGEHSKLVIMGDLNQRDEKITKEATGMYKFINNELSKKSPLVAVVQLEKCERGPVSELFANVFEV